MFLSAGKIMECLGVVIFRQRVESGLVERRGGDEIPVSGKECGGGSFLLLAKSLDNGHGHRAG